MDYHDVDYHDLEYHDIDYHIVDYHDVGYNALHNENESGWREQSRGVNCDGKLDTILLILDSRISNRITDGASSIEYRNRKELTMTETKCFQ